MKRGESKSLMRSLGEFVGHIWRAARTDPRRRGITARRAAPPERGGGGKVILRRTTVEEVELRPDDLKARGGD